ncbi:sensor domain-containing diguanylate cyclase [Pseudomonas benzenivorans]|uniref:diguanylate cyclase n=1 Tax=Pseudomonas benzenivorans TaxID=556533 RepID=A0ABY5HBI5_9PSED|nr:diguanylate cyclase [Pseudomonas benzenivorans]UTW09702.1 GGDEF domain-containing protein [Pseudomonas benzenivorans]
MTARPAWLPWLCWLAWLIALPAPALAWYEVAEQSQPLGLHLSLLPTPEPISLAAAIRARQNGAFQPSQHDVPRLGIGAAAHWLYLPLFNPSDRPLRRTLQLGKAWVDQLDVHLLSNGRLLQQLQAGDDQLRGLQATPGMGYLLALELPPGRSELYVHARSTDPLVLPMRLLSDSDVQQASAAVQYSYGALYGFLLALMAYNLMLWAGLKDRNNLNYSLYLGAFILLNLSYTGHAGAWLWPDSLFLKRYANPAMMSAAAWLGLHFARHFLELDAHAPRLARAVSRGATTSVLLMLLCIGLDWHAPALWLAFVSVLVYTLLMVLLGCICLRHGQVAARYFLAATLCGMLGTALTDLSVWGLVPFSTLTYRAVDIGIALEASLLALALAYQMRQHQRALRRAQSLAYSDPLTGLLNRRAFIEQGNALWSTTRRHGQPLTLIMFDLDHFKRINDEHGHDMGDDCLTATARVLTQQCRAGDLLARWGGEEFLLLLPATRVDEAVALAERLRHAIASLTLESRVGQLTLSASFGVVSREQHTRLEELISSADERLYRAKQDGRNRVCGPQTDYC